MTSREGGKGEQGANEGVFYRGVTPFEHSSGLGRERAADFLAFRIIRQYEKVIHGSVAD